MILVIKYQEQYSRGELLLRTFFGFLYIALPHLFLLTFVGLAAAVLNFLAFWVILFTGRYPESWFEFQVNYQRWTLRFTARMLNIADGYPAFGLKAEDEHVTFEVPYPERVSRGLTLVRLLFGFFYVIIPHGMILGLLNVAVSVVVFLAWFAVLFTGRYPKSMFDFVVYFLRWNQRVSLYLGYMTDRYPPFSGDPDEQPVEPGVEGSRAADEGQSNSTTSPGRSDTPSDSGEDSGDDGDDKPKQD